MTIAFRIYDTEYWIDEFQDGHGWVSNTAESTQAFPAPYLAQQDAMRYEGERQMEQSKSYANCRHRYWDERREI